MLFKDKKSLIGMIHTGPLPGAPRHAGEPVAAMAERAAVEARVLIDAGYDAIIVENMHDAPYVHGDALGPEIVAAMTRISCAVAVAIGPDIPLGIQILSGGNKHALGVAQACGGAFIRCENFVFAHVADEGLLPEAEAGPLLRHRGAIGAEAILVFCDIKKKHASHSITGDLSLAEAAEAAVFFGADGLVVTGSATGKPTSAVDVRTVKDAAGGVPVLVGSGVTPADAGGLLEYADALIVGSWIKEGGRWTNPVDPKRAAELVRVVRG